MSLSFFTSRQYREEKILDWIAVGLLFFVTAFIWAPSRDGLQVVFAFAFLLPLMAVLPFRKPEFHAYGGWLTILALIFGFYATLSSIWAPVSKPSFFVIQLIVLGVWLLGINWLSSRRLIDWIKIQELLLSIGALIGVLGLIIFYGSHPLTLRMEGNFAARNPNEVGALFGILTLLAFVRWLSSSNFGKSFHYATLALVLCVPALLSQSRGALLALLITCVMALFYVPTSRKKIWLLICVGFAGFVASWHFLPELAADRLSTGFRDIIWREVFSRSLNDHLWLGLGMEKFEKIIIPDVDVFHHAHNAWLDTFYRTGLIGLLIALTHVFVVLKKFKQSEILTPFYLWLMFGLIASMFDYRSFFWQIDFKWFLFWIPIGLISAALTQEQLFQVKGPGENKNGLSLDSGESNDD